MSTPHPWLAACAAADALRKLNIEARQGALENLRARDPALAESVEALLEGEQEPGSSETRLTSTDPVSSTLFDWSAAGTPIIHPEGTRIGPYVLGPVLGAGSMGTVYRAERVVPYKQQVALKLMHATLDSTALRRFEAERQFLAALEHPGIVRLLDGGATPEGIPYLVTEFIDGPRIDVYAANPAHRLDDRVELILQVALAIAHAHRCNVLHRDLSPANVLVAPGGTAKVTDFGLARPTPDAKQKAALSESGALLGTPGYIAPERLLGGAASNSPAADIYAIGALLYRVLAGRAPFKGPTAIQTCLMAAEQDPVPLNRIEPTLPVDLNTIVQKALSRDPGDRFASADQFADQLRRYLEREPLTISPPTRRERLSKWSLKNRKTIRAWAASMSLVLLCAISLLAFWNQGLRRDRAALQQALKTVSSTSAKLVESQPPGSNGTYPILENFLDELDSVLGKGLLPDDPALGRQVAKIHLAQGRACHELLDFQEGVAHLDQAIELLTPLPPRVQNATLRRWYKFDLFRCYQARGATHESLGNLALALADYQSAIPLIVAIGREEPENPDWIEAEARLRSNLAGLELRRGRIQDAEAESNQALELATRAHALAPGQPAITNTLLAIHLVCAQIARELNQMDRVERELIEACESADLVLDSGEYDWAVASARLAALEQLGEHFVGQARLDEARATLEEALAICTSLLAQFPTNGRYHLSKGHIVGLLYRCGPIRDAPHPEARSEEPLSSR